MTNINFAFAFTRCQLFDECMVHARGVRVSWIPEAPKPGLYGIAFQHCRSSEDTHDVIAADDDGGVPSLNE